ncbi:MAG TPA: glycosyltransferase [Anaerolineaceae bacterium]|nr:glycosyltransferase [Anaerolineaceae bacterium]
MQISVIIPVYNAEDFVTLAVESALAQPETGEVILIEDGSPDNSLTICQELEEKYNKVRLLRHPHGRNKGAAASRNLGMKNARFNYIAFLDADDYYLPGRFSVTKKVFEDDPECDGVYELFEPKFESEEAEERWKLARKPNVNRQSNASVSPEDLAVALINGEVSNFHMDGLVIKKAALKKSGLMNTSLTIGEDTDFAIKLALTSKLHPGSDKPVVVYRFHEHNQFTAYRSSTKIGKQRIELWTSLYRWSKQNSTSAFQEVSIKKLIGYISKTRIIERFPTRYFSVGFLTKNRLIFFSFCHPYTLKEAIFRKSILHPDCLNTTQGNS